jgi:hypothetical protein
LTGCTSLAVTVRVDEKQTARIGEADRQRLVNTDDREIAKAHEELERAKTEWARAQKMVRAVDAERNATRDTQILRVVEVKGHWASAFLLWRTTQVESARRHELAALAKEELDKAEIVSRNGVDLDVARFRGQYARLHEAWSQYSQKLATAHATADTQERQLAEAKGRYAHDKLAVPQPATDEPRQPK